MLKIVKLVTQVLQRKKYYQAQARIHNQAASNGERSSGETKMQGNVQTKPGGCLYSAFREKILGTYQDKGNVSFFLRFSILCYEVSVYLHTFCGKERL